MQVIKGMVQVGGSTYRIVRVRPSQYAVIRIQDDLAVGGFTSFPRVEVTTSSIELSVMREIARVAVLTGKTSWAQRLAH
jgi:hypothetical protein